MSVLKCYFDKSVNQASRVCDDFVRKVNYDEKGNEFITWEKFDYPTFQKSNGSALDWSLDALLKVGINPDFGIRTGFNSRLDGLDELSSAADKINALLDSDFPADTDDVNEIKK